MSCERLKNIQTELLALVNNPNANNEDYKAFYAKYNIPYTNDVEKKIIDSCATIIAQFAENTMEIPQECIDSTKKLCLAIDPNGQGSWYYDECFKKYGPYLISNFQLNDSTIISNCKINTILGDPALANDKTLGIVVAMIMGDRLITCDPSSTNDFTDTFGSDEKIKAFNDCLNSSLVNQKNYISGCRLQNKIQKNISDNIDTCIINTTLSQTPSPTTQSPTTRSPTTRSPTTRSPTTRSPTTRSPTTTQKIITNKPMTTLPSVTTPLNIQNNSQVLYIVIGIVVCIIGIVFYIKYKKIIL
jgi:hypothetical protein